MDAIAILDFGSQYAQLIARRVRELQVYCELFPWDAPAEQVLALHPKGFILSGGPASVYEPQAPVVPSYVLSRRVPILGICYGMQALTQALGGEVAPSTEREYGPAEVETLADNPLIPLGSQRVWMSHGDRIQKLPAGFVTLGQSGNSPIAFMGDLKRRYFGLQFHPEVHHTPGGKDILRRFVVDICQARPDWTPEFDHRCQPQTHPPPGRQPGGALGGERRGRLDRRYCHGPAGCPRPAHRHFRRYRYVAPG